MSKKPLFIVFAIIIVIACAGIFVASKGGDGNSTSPPQSNQQDQTLQPEANNNAQEETTETPGQTSSTPSAANSAGQYVAYSEGIITSSKGQKVLFFHAPWCPQCRSIESGIESQGVPSGFTIIKVDYDTSQELRQKYGVTLQTTFVKVDDNGEFISKFVAYSEPTFDAVKRDYLL